MDLPLARAVASRVEVVTRTGSTNADLRAVADDAANWPHLAALITRNQTAGRGRLDRTWVAPDGSALAISVLLRDVPSDPAARGWIPLAAGLAMSEAIAAQLPGHDVAVKWPNDVLVDGRKVCGILAEATSDGVIVGAGVNTAMTVDELPVVTATSFAALGFEADEDRLLAGYLTVLGRVLAELVATGDARASGLHAAVSARCSTLGADVRVSLPGDRILDGTAIVIDAEGRLMVASEGVDHAISAGDVVHVRPAGS